MEYMVIKHIPYEGDDIIYNLSKEAVLLIIKEDMDDYYTIHPMPTDQWDRDEFIKEFS